MMLVRMAAVAKIQQKFERAPRLQQILERISVEHGQESFRRVAECAPEHTAIFYSTEAIRALQAAGHAQLILNLSNDGPYTDLRWFARESQAAVLATNCFQIAELAKLMNDLHDVAFGDVKVFDDLPDGRKLATFRAHIHEYAQSIICVKRQAHMGSSKSRKKQPIGLSLDY